MKRLASLWKRKNGQRLSAGAAWPISAPFIVSIRFDGLLHNGDADAAAAKWIALVDAVVGTATQIFFEGGDLLASPVAPRILTHADSCGVRFHVETDGNWSDPVAIIHLLKSLKRLGSLRMRVAADVESGGPLLTNLRHAVAAGLTVWGTVMPGSADALRKSVVLLNACGVAGVALRRADEPMAEAVWAEAVALDREGYSVAFDDCPPPGRSDGLACRCSGGFGSCTIDGQGTVRICRHDLTPVGNLYDTPLDVLWTSPALQARRTMHGGHRGLCRIQPLRHDAKVQDASEGAEERAVAAALDPALAPVALYRIRSEPFGAVLINDFDFIAVSAEGARIAAAFDGKRSLQEIEGEFGAAATILAFSLFCRKWLRFRRRAREPRPAPVGDEVEGR